MINPMKTKDYVTLGNMLGGLFSMVASSEGDVTWAIWWMFIAWVFDSFDGLVARATGGGNKFGEVFDNLTDLIAYSLAPTFFLYLIFRLPIDQGGAGWPKWPALLFASIPTITGSIRFTRNNVKDIIMNNFHMGLPRTVFALTVASLYGSHLFQNSWMRESQSNLPVFSFAALAVYILILNFLVLSLKPFFSKPHGKAGGGLMFCAMWFLITTPLAFIAGVIVDDMRWFFDTFVFNFSVYIWFGFTIMQPEQIQAAKAYIAKLKQEWKSEMG